VRFEMLAPDIVTIDDQDWCAGSVRAPSVVVEDGRTRMWFAGDNWETGRYGSRDLRRKDSPVEMGIGLAELR